MNLATADLLGLVVNNMPIYFPDELKSWSGGDWTHYPLSSVEGVSHDTRALLPGNLYVALQGERTDGHRFVEAAFERGAAAALVTEHFAYHYMGDQPLLQVTDTREGLKRLARGYVQALPALQVGITGSVGKTTVKEMLADVLAKTATTGRTRGNWNNAIGLPLSLMNMWRDDDFGVFELGINHPGELQELCSILQPRVGVMTPIGPVHIEYFGSEKAIAEEKAVLLQNLPGDGLAVLDAEDAWFDLFREAAPCRVVSISLGDRGDYHGTADGRLFHVTEPSGASATLGLPLPGTHIMRDALLAYATGRELGVDAAAAAEALRQFRPLPMRWNVLEVNGVQVVNDSYNANPVSMRAALETFAAQPCPGRRWLVLGSMYELGDAAGQAHRDLGAQAASLGTELVTVGHLGADIADGAVGAGMDPARITHCANPEEVASLLIQRVRPGDQVLLKASRGEHLEDVLEHWRKN